MDKPFEHAAIIGCGLLGASLGMALRQRGLARRVTGVGRRGSDSVRVAMEHGAIDRATDDASAAVSGGRFAGESAEMGHPVPADLVVVCTPVRQFPAVFREIGPALAAGTLVTDVGSTKEEVMRWAQEILPPPPQVHFIGSHPMAGSEKSGPAAAREDLYERGACLICKPEGWRAGESDQALARINHLWRAVGMRIIECTGRQHDEWVAAVSHLPHAIASSLVKAAAADPAALETAASGFIDTSRIASGDVTMWVDILMTNRPAVVSVIDRFNKELSALQAAVKDGDEQAIRSMLARAKQTRDAFIAKRKAMASAEPAPAEPTKGA